MFLTKKRHELEVSEALEKEQKRCTKTISSMQVTHRQNEADLKKNLKEVVGNLTKVSVVRGYDEGRNKWRVVVDLDPYMMSMALERGNDKEMISYIADEVKYKVEGEIRSCNIQRPADLNLGRPKW